MLQIGDWVKQPFLLPSFALLIATTYISLDTAFSITGYFDTSIDVLQSAWLFSLTIIWPAIAILIFYIINLTVTFRVLRETKPLSKISIPEIRLICNFLMQVL